MTTIKLIASGSLQACEELKSKIRWLEIGAIQNELQRVSNRNFYDPSPAQSVFNRFAGLMGPEHISLEDAVQRYTQEQEKVLDLVTVTPDKKFGAVCTQDIKTRLSPYALMEEFNRPDEQPTFARMLNETTVELYGTPDLAINRLGPEKIIGMINPEYRWFDKRDAIKAHHP